MDAPSASGSAGGGAGAGKAVFSDVAVTKAFDGETTALFNAITTGQHLDSVGLTTTQHGLALTSAFVTSESLSDDGTANGAPVEKVTFAYQKFQQTVGSVVAGWDIGQNIAF